MLATIALRLWFFVLVATALVLPVAAAMGKLRRFRPAHLKLAAGNAKGPPNGRPFSHQQIWCPGEDSNLHVVKHTDLNRARLPIPPPGQTDGRRYVGEGARRVNRGFGIGVRFAWDHRRQAGPIRTPWQP